MSKEKTKELIVCLITLIVLVFAVATNVFATSGGIDVLNQAGNKNANNISDVEDRTNNTNSNRNSNTNSNTNSNSNTNTNKNTNSNVNSNKNNTLKMPNTGVDYSIVFIVIVCGISAVYAYKKIKDYNNF